MFRRIARRRLLTHFGGFGAGLGASSIQAQGSGSPTPSLGPLSRARALALTMSSGQALGATRLLAYARRPLDTIRAAGTTLRFSLCVGFSTIAPALIERAARASASPASGGGATGYAGHSPDGVVCLRLGGTLDGNNGFPVMRAELSPPNNNRVSLVQGSLTIRELGDPPLYHGSLVTHGGSTLVDERESYAWGVDTRESTPLKITGFCHNTSLGLRLHSALIEVIEPDELLEAI